MTATLSVLMALVGCTKDGSISDTTDTVIGGTDSGDVVDDTGEQNNNKIEATVTGIVTVQLWDYDEDGEVQMVTYEDATGGTFPFGSIWVTTYQDNGNGERYFGSDTIALPTPDGDGYAIDLNLVEAQDLRVYARLDYHGEGIVLGGDPIGIYPDEISVTASETYGDVDITILAYYDADGSDGPGGDGGPGCTETVDVSGDVLISTSYAGGDAVVMLTEPGGVSPSDWVFVRPEGHGDGAAVGYSMTECVGAGTYQLLGAWDSDGDGLITNADTWGAYITEPDTAGPDIVIGSSDLTEHDVQIPLGDGESPWGVVPFVTVSGDLGVLDGTFDDLPEGTTVYVSALKYRPGADVAAATLADDAYDLETFAWADLAGNATLPYSLTLPGNTIVYLWAYADTDGDGVLNEPGEPVASSGVNASGKFPTGSASSSGVGLELNAP